MEVTSAFIKTRRRLMKTRYGFVLSVAVASMWVAPAGATVQEVIDITNQAVTDLAVYPGNGKRATAYDQPQGMGKFWGADYRQYKKATLTLKSALEKARAEGLRKEAVFKLEEAVEAGQSGLHKDARLKAQGALAHLCREAAPAAPPVCQDEEQVPKSGVLFP